MYYAEPNLGEAVIVTYGDDDSVGKKMLRDHLAKRLSPERQALLDAADYIDRHGWCQGRFWTPEGWVCASEAIMKVALYGVAGAAGHILMQYVYATSGMACNVPGWNDAPGNTKEQVTSAMRAAAVWNA